MKIIFSGVFLLLMIGIYLVVDAGQASDKERERMGLGPKGQGR